MTVRDLDPSMRMYRPARRDARGVAGSRLLGVEADNYTALIQALEEGVGFEVLERVARSLFTDAAEALVVHGSGSAGRGQAGLRLANLVGMSESTYRRRQKSGALSAKESEGVYRYAALLERAADVFGSEALAREWLRGPVLALGGVTPLEYARTEPGAAFVLQVLGRLEHGVYS